MNKNGKCFTGPTKNLLYNDTNGNIYGFVNINVFYKQNYANKGVGDIAHAPGISKQSCLLLFQIYTVACWLLWSEWPGLGSWEWR